LDFPTFDLRLIHPFFEFRIAIFEFPAPTGAGGVANGTRTRNSQNHNLELYH
jgi:hypothetical protein